MTKHYEVPLKEAWNPELDKERSDIWMPFSYLEKQSKFLYARTDGRITGKTVIETNYTSIPLKDCSLSRTVKFFLNDACINYSSPILLLSVEYPLGLENYPMAVTYYPINCTSKTFTAIECEYKLNEWLGNKVTNNIIDSMISDTNLYFKTLPKNEKNIN